MGWLWTRCDRGVREPWEAPPIMHLGLEPCMVDLGDQESP